MKIDIYSDLVCPWCFIGKRHLELALAQCIAKDQQLSFELNWVPFQLNPEMPTNGMARSDYLAMKFGGKSSALRIYDNIKIAGEKTNIPFNFDRIKYQPNTTTAHLLVKFITELKPKEDIVEQLFQAYFFDGKDIGDISTLQQIGRGFGADMAELDNYISNKSNQAKILNHTTQALNTGIQSVPVFIIDNNILVSGARSPGDLTKLVLQNVTRH